LSTHTKRLIARTEGNPFFLEESVRALVETRMLVGEPGAYHLAQALPTIQVPATVQAVLAARIDRLPPEEKRLLQTAAVIGTEVPLPLLQALAEMPEEGLQHGLTRLQAAEFLYETRLFPEREYTFKHALTHEVAYGSLLQERRRVLHAQIVTAITQLSADRLAEHVEHLAHHALRGEVWDQALVYCRQAGAKAFTRSANREAVAYFEQALTALVQLPERHDTLEQAVDLRFDLHNALMPLDEQARLLDHLYAAEAIAERLADPQRLGRIAGYLCMYFSTRGEHARAIAAGQRALALASTSGVLDVQVSTQANLGLAYYAAGDFRQGLDVARRVAALIPSELYAARFGLPILPAAIHRGFVAWGLVELGDFAAGTGMGEDAVRLSETVAHPASMAAALWFAGLVSCRQGDVHTAIRLLEQGLALSQLANILIFPILASLLSVAYALAGRTAEALPLLDQMRERVGTGHRMFCHALVLTELSEALLLVGRMDEARTSAGRLLELSRTHTGRGYQAHAYRLLGDVARRREPLDVGQATAYYHQAQALADELGLRPLQAHCHRSLGTLYATIGQREQARAALSMAAEMYRDMEMTFWLPETEAALAQVEKQ
jgi:tetratricopeptide (TPR) repeat protein